MKTHWHAVFLSFLLGLTLVFAAGCRPRTSPLRSILPDDCRLQAGDVVFRQGIGATSQAVRMADAGGAYSHVGIVVDSAGVMLVVHAVPGESGRADGPDRVKADPLPLFFRSDRARKGAVMRPGDTAAGVRAACVAWGLYRRGVLFDHDYDSRDTTRMYCTELVVHAYRQAHCPLPCGEGRRVSLPGIDGRCIFPSDLLGSPSLRPVASF